MKFIRINAGGLAEVIELEGQDTIDCDKMKELLGFDSPMTVVERKINGRYYDLWCDDEGLLMEDDKRIVGAMLLENTGVHEYIIGNILVLAHDEEGNSIGLTDDQILGIMLGKCLINMDDFCEFTGEDKECDKRIYGYFDDGSLTVKAHSQILTYGL